MRFKNNQNGTVTDTKTGLVWLKDANPFDIVDWNTALDRAKGLENGQCGLTDGSTAGQWRLPNVQELTSLISYGYVNPALPRGHPFINVQLENYWSSTIHVGSPVFIWYVSLRDGRVDAHVENVRYFVWPVRSVQTSQIRR